MKRRASDLSVYVCVYGNELEVPVRENISPCFLKVILAYIASTIKEHRRAASTQSLRLVID